MKDENCIYRSCILIFFVAMPSSCSNSPLRVACMQESPPFVYSAQGQCVGLFADAFSAAATSINIQYHFYFLNTSSLAALAGQRPICQNESEIYGPENCVLNRADPVSVLFHTNQSLCDVGIIFTSATPEQLSYVDLSVPLVQSYYAVLVGPKYAKSGGDIIDAIFSQEVLYIVGIIFLVTLGTSIIYFVLESFISTAEILEIDSYSGRLCVCFMVALSNLLTIATVTELANPASNVVHIIVSFVSLYLLTLFAAVICAELTSASLTSTAPLLRDLSGARIACMEPALCDFLLSSQVNAAAIPYASLGPAVAAFYGDNPDRLDGFAAQPETVDYYLNVYAAAAAAQPYGITAPFAPSGSPDPRGLFLSKVSASESAPAPPTAALRLNFWA